MPVTIRDVADRAGTSVAAVSAVISANPRHNIRIGRATRERILAAAADLGYRPNPLAKGLASGKIGVIGLVFPYSRAFTDGNPFATGIMSGVFEEVIRERYNVMLHTAVGEDWGAADDDRALLDRRVDGLVLVLPTAHSPVIQRCRAAGFPYVAVVYEPDGADVFAVNAAEEAGGRVATEHLLSLGHRRIAHLEGGPRVASTKPRRLGYLAALRDAGVPAETALVEPAGFTERSGYEAARRLLALPASERPTAIFAANDLCADGAMRAAREAGMSVPGDLAVVGFDDTWFAERTDPPLTTVHMPLAEMGIAAAALLIAQVEDRAIPARQAVLPVKLSVRASSGASRAPSNTGALPAGRSKGGDP